MGKIGIKQQQKQQNPQIYSVPNCGPCFEGKEQSPLRGHSGELAIDWAGATLGEECPGQEDLRSVGEENESRVPGAASGKGGVR